MSVGSDKVCFFYFKNYSNLIFCYLCLLLSSDTPISLPADQ